jgi:hypothetical protein
MYESHGVVRAGFGADKYLLYCIICFLVIAYLFCASSRILKAMQMVAQVVTPVLTKFTIDGDKQDKNLRLLNRS